MDDVCPLGFLKLPNFNSLYGEKGHYAKCRRKPLMRYGPYGDLSFVKMPPSCIFQMRIFNVPWGEKSQYASPFPNFVAISKSFAKTWRFIDVFKMAPSAIFNLLYTYWDHQSNRC